MEFEVGQTVLMPRFGYPQWAQNMYADVHAKGPRGLIHLRFDFGKYRRYLTMTERELDDRLYDAKLSGVVKPGKKKKISFADLYPGNPAAVVEESPEVIRMCISCFPAHEECNEARRTDSCRFDSVVEVESIDAKDLERGSRRRSWKNGVARTW